MSRVTASAAGARRGVRSGCTARASDGGASRGNSDRRGLGLSRGPTGNHGRSDVVRAAAARAFRVPVSIVVFEPTGADEHEVVIGGDQSLKLRWLGHEPTFIVAPSLDGSARVGWWRRFGVIGDARRANPTLLAAVIHSSQNAPKER